MENQFLKQMKTSYIVLVMTNDQKSTDQFETNRQQYILDKNNTDNTHTSNTRTNSLPHTCNIDPQKLK